MTQQKAASLTSSLFARKGRASPARLLISELEAAGAAPLGDSAERSAAANGRAGGANGRRKPKAAAELPLLAFVEAQSAAEETPEGHDAPAAPAGGPAPAASLLERGAGSLRRVNGRGSAAAPPAPPAPVAAAENIETAAGDADAAVDAELDDVGEAETVSGDANVASIEDAPQDDEVAATAPAAEPAVEPAAALPAAVTGPSAERSEEPAAVEPAAVEPELAQPAAVMPPKAVVASSPMPATLALRKAAALQTQPAAPVEVAPPPPRSQPLIWRSAAVIALGAALGLGFYLVWAGEPAAPQLASAPATAPAVVAVAPLPPASQAAAEQPSTVSPAATAAVEAALPEPSFDIIRIEPDGQSIIAGRALPGSEWILLNNGNPIASVRADANGEWVVLPDAALVPGANAFSLVPKAERGKVAIPAPAALAPAPTEPLPASQPEAAAGQRSGAAAPAPALPRPKPQAAAAAAASPEAFQSAAEGAYEVQLASVRQNADADRERLRLSTAFPALLGAMDLRVQEARLEDSGVFYRVRSGAIGELGVARDLCRRLEAAGQGCLVVRRPEAPQSDVAAEVPDAASAVRQQAERLQ